MHGALSRLRVAQSSWIRRPMDGAERTAQVDIMEGLQP